MSQFTLLQESFDNTVSGVSGGSFSRTTKNRTRSQASTYVIWSVSKTPSSVIQHTKDSLK
jgi:hypothetical protein